MDTQNSFISSSDHRHRDQAWRCFVRVTLSLLIALAVLSYLFVLLVDPYDSLSFSPDFERVPVDGTQRLFYPALARKQAFDSAVIGNSNVRLLRPAQLDDLLGGRFANLGMNAASSWEQEQLFNIFVRYHDDIRNVIFGIDYLWCIDRYAGVKFAGDNTAADFPDWLFDQDPDNNWPPLNSGTLIHAWVQLAVALGMMKSEYGHDGYTVFTKPMDEYDLDKARLKIYGSVEARQKPPVQPPVIMSAGQKQAIPISALGRLQRMLSSLPTETRKILLFVPYHHYFQAAAGSKQAIVWEECKNRTIDMAASTDNLYVLDFMIRSRITTRDSNYWDYKHYTVDVAERLGKLLGEAVDTGNDNPNYRILASP